MRRRDKQLSDTASLELLRLGEWGVLCLAGDGAYGVPLNYALDEPAAGLWPNLLLHCAPQGVKIDAIRKNPAVCFTVVLKAYTLPEELSSDYASVIVNAQAEIIADRQERIRTLKVLGRHFSAGRLRDEAIDAYIAKRLDRVEAIRLCPTQVTGKAKQPTHTMRE